MISFDDLLDIISHSEGYDIPKITQAYEAASAAHEGQMRKSGEPYITHPLSVAVILADMGMDTASVVTALLHDVVEDTEIALDVIRKEFGTEVARLVDGLTKLGKIPFSSREEQQAENIRKMLISMAQDVRVIIIKLADRLHNVRTLRFMPEQKQRDISLETMEVYAPIAHRLGMLTVKEELEDYSIRYLDPTACEEIEKQLQTKADERARFIEKIKKKISERLEAGLGESFAGLTIEGRVKSLYSIYRKHIMQGRAFDEIYDIYAIRVIVNTVPECYNVLGEIHDMYRPLAHRFKDYISAPKGNMYQSLHTTVFDKNATPFEVQIRTWEMHRTAELGIAAHWKYKAGIQGRDRLEEKIAWVRQLLDAQKDAEDSQEILGAIKSDLTADEVYVFTPKGDVITLPTGATVIDFAYAIHTQVGNHMVGAKVDGRMVSLDTVVQTGQIVSVTTAKGQGPSRDWIGIVKTASTRNKIRSWFKKERREENIRQGRESLEKELKRNQMLLEPEQFEEFLRKAAKSQRMNSVDEFLAALGYGGISLSKIIPRLKDMYTREYKETQEALLRRQMEKAAAQRPRKASGGVIVEGMDNCLVKFSKCCGPLPGDSIIGYITRGYGVSVHKRDCVNVRADIEGQKERWVACEWSETSRHETFKTTVDLLGRDRQGLLMDVSIALNNMRVPVYDLSAHTQNGDHTAIQITFGSSGVEQLDYLLRTLRKISGVEKVERSIQ